MADQSEETIPEGSTRVFNKTISIKVLEILQLLEQTKSYLINYVDSISNGTDESLKNEPNFNKLKEFSYSKLPEYISLLFQNSDLFNNEEFFNLLNNDVAILYSHVSQLQNSSPFEIAKILNKAQNFIESFRGIEVAIIALKNTNLILQNELRPKIEEVQRQVEDIERAKLALQNDRIHSVFEAYEKKLKDEADKWERRFFWTLGIGASTASLLAFCPDLKVGFWNYIFLKVLIVSIVITLSTYFLRRSIHLRKQSDEMERAAFEMDALPSFMSGLDHETSQTVIVGLIPNYFGRTIDQTQNDKIGDLVQDQLSAGTELIRASAELVKANSESTSKSQP